MFCTMRSARLPCLAICSGVEPQVIDEVFDVGHAEVGVGGEFVVEFAGELLVDLGEVVDEVERVLDLVRDARRQLTQRRHLF